MVHSVLSAVGNRLANTPACSMGECGSQSGLHRFSATVRSIRVKRRMASASCGVVPYQKAPEIIERGITLSVKKSVLQAVRLVVRKAVSDVDHVPRLEPLALAYHKHKGIFLALPRHPIVPADVGPYDRFVANIKLRLERKRMPGGVRGLPELGRNTLESVKIHAVRANILEQLRDCYPGKNTFLSRPRIPGNNREKYFHSNRETLAPSLEGWERRPGDHAKDRTGSGRLRRDWDKRARSVRHRWGRCGFPRRIESGPRYIRQYPGRKKPGPR